MIVTSINRCAHAPARFGAAGPYRRVPDRRVLAGKRFDVGLASFRTGLGVS
jgi:hypothetical protein